MYHKTTIFHQSIILLNSSLGVDIKLIDGVPNWSERGADTWSPFKSATSYEVLATSFGTINDALKYDYIVVSSFLYTSGISSGNWNNSNYGKTSISGATIISNMVNQNYYWENGRYEVRSYSVVIEPTSDTVTISGAGNCTVIGFYVG